MAHSTSLRVQTRLVRNLKLERRKIDWCVGSVYSNYRRAMNSREVIRQLRKDGWYEVNQVGSHKQFKHALKQGRVTVPHPSRDIPIGTLRSIEKQAGLKLT